MSSSLKAKCISRDEKKELTNIKFDFIPGEDKVEVISQELVEAKLIDGNDMVTGQNCFRGFYDLISN
jgi:hypothetical protein